MCVCVPVSVRLEGKACAHARTRSVKTDAPSPHTYTHPDTYTHTHPKHTYTHTHSLSLSLSHTPTLQLKIPTTPTTPSLTDSQGRPRRGGGRAGIPGQGADDLPPTLRAPDPDVLLRPAGLLVRFACAFCVGFVDCVCAIPYVYVYKFIY